MNKRKIAAAAALIVIACVCFCFDEPLILAASGLAFVGAVLLLVEGEPEEVIIGHRIYRVIRRKKKEAK